MKIKVILFLLLIGFALNGYCQCVYKVVEDSQTNYDTTKPWAFWWWMGNAVTKEGIKKNMEDYARAGIGGLHIIPVYGVKGFEKSFVPYLSKQWGEMLNYTLEEARNFNLGIDMTLGTGWPFGGKDINNQQNAQRLFFQKIDITEGQHIIVKNYSATNIQSGAELQSVILYEENGMEGRDVTTCITKKGFLTLKNSKKGQYLLLQYSVPTSQKVKRAAPGGEGLVLDYFSSEAVNSYLQTFQNALGNYRYKSPNFRAYYNDSYEVSQANWTLSFPDQFKVRRGYDVKPFLRIFDKKDTLTDDERRICTDYYETIADLVCESFTNPVTTWCNNHHMLFRDQAHGSPGNWLDLYAATDIPETEYFGSKMFSIPFYRMDADYEKQRFGSPSTLMLKFASSAANVTGKKLVSSETSTWLANHFKVSLSQIKPEVDELFVSGINHIFYHGITYSPPNEPWPGWLFYASTNYNQQSHFWNDLPELNNYITNCQSLLQNTVSDNDVLVYYPIQDYWQGLATFREDPMLTVHSDTWLSSRSIGKLAGQLESMGYSFDYISDKQLAKCKTSEYGSILTEKSVPYRVLIIPEIEFIPFQTMVEINRLVDAGIKVIFEKKLPAGISGYFNWKERQKTFESLSKKIALNSIVRDNPAEALAMLHIRKEVFPEHGLRFIRKNLYPRFVYFVTNQSMMTVSDSVKLSVSVQDHSLISDSVHGAGATQSVQYYDPLRNTCRRYPVQNDSSLVPIRLESGESVFLITGIKDVAIDPLMSMNYGASQPVNMTGDWLIDFIVGEPVVPSSLTTNKLRSWTELGDSTHQWFCGKAMYRLSFPLPPSIVPGQGCWLNLGDVRESAAVWMNDTYLGKAWCLPFKVWIPEGLLKSENKLEVEVTNLSANRIRKMDIDKIPWKKFYDINMVDITYKPFDASAWKPVSSGLLGPVTLTTMK